MTELDGAINPDSCTGSLSKSVSNDPNVLVSRCFDTVEEAVKADYRPAGFSCWSGSGSAVVVPSSR